MRYLWVTVSIIASFVACVSGVLFSLEMIDMSSNLLLTISIPATLLVAYDLGNYHDKLRHTIYVHLPFLTILKPPATIYFVYRYSLLDGLNVYVVSALVLSITVLVTLAYVAIRRKNVKTSLSFVLFAALFFAQSLDMQNIETLILNVLLVSLLVFDDLDKYVAPSFYVAGVFPMAYFSICRFSDLNNPSALVLNVLVLAFIVVTHIYTILHYGRR